MAHNFVTTKPTLIAIICVSVICRLFFIVSSLRSSKATGATNLKLIARWKQFLRNGQ